jgi:FdhD protein
LSSVHTFEINQFNHSGQLWESAPVIDNIIAEEPLEVWVRILANPAQASTMTPKPLLTLMRTPGDDINLVKGWLLTSGVIDMLKQIKAIHHSGVNRLKQGSSNRVLVTLSADVKIDFAEFNRQEYASSACGVCGQQNIETILLRLEQKNQLKSRVYPPLNVANMGALMAQFSQALPVFEQTGGNHGVALFNQRTGIVDVREDVGRHNALDKLIGANAELLFSANERNDGLGVILSGRVGFEMIQKAAMANINYVLALGAPSSLAIELAKEADIVLVGFIKAQRFNVYSGQQRLVLPK